MAMHGNLVNKSLTILMKTGRMLTISTLPQGNGEASGGLWWIKGNMVERNVSIRNESEEWETIEGRP